MSCQAPLPKGLPNSRFQSKMKFFTQNLIDLNSIGIKSVLLICCTLSPDSSFVILRADRNELLEKYPGHEKEHPTYPGYLTGGKIIFWCPCRKLLRL